MPDGEITMSVGYEQLRWEEGKVIVFDDTYIHQAQVHLVSRCVPVLMATDPSKRYRQVVHNGLEPRYVMCLGRKLAAQPSKEPVDVPSLRFAGRRA